MVRMTFCAFVCLMAACGTRENTSWSDMNVTRPYMEVRPKIAAHRGLRSEAPENTHAAFDASVEAGIDWFELDFGLSGDGELIVMHDDTLNRTTNIEALMGNRRHPLTRTPSSVVDKLDAGSWFSPKYADEPVPTLRDTLEQFSGHSNIILDYKSGRPEDLIAALPNHSARGNLIVQSRDFEFAKKIKQLLPDQRVTYLGDGRLNEGKIRAARKAKLDGISWNHRFIGKHEANLCKQNELDLWVYTVKKPKDALRLMDFGLAGIITDIPDFLRYL